MATKLFVLFLVFSVALTIVLANRASVPERASASGRSLADVELRIESISQREFATKNDGVQGIIARILEAIRGKSPRINPPFLGTPVPEPLIQRLVYADSQGKPLYSNGACRADVDCVPAGCSNQVCSSDPGIITTCEIRPDFPNTDTYSCGCVETRCVWYSPQK